jgi:hypothetical protein
MRKCHDKPVVLLITSYLFSDKTKCHPIWLFNIAMENGPFIDDFPINASIYKGFSMAILNNQMSYCSLSHSIPTLRPVPEHVEPADGTSIFGCLPGA